jgi:hypothetical protein
VKFTNLPCLKKLLLMFSRKYFSKKISLLAFEEKAEKLNFIYTEVKLTINASYVHAIKAFK